MVFLVILVLFSVPVFAQTTDTDVINRVISNVSYGLTHSLNDQYGNLVIFDSIYTLTPVPVPLPFPTPTAGATSVAVLRPLMAPKTRITVIPDGGGQPIFKEYDGNIQLVGAGKSAIYAVTYGFSLSNGLIAITPRRLIAIDVGAAGTQLPPDTSGFLSADLTSSGEVRLTPGTAVTPDTITCVDPAGNAVFISPAGAVRPTRVARTIRFDGLRFSSVDVTLPQ